MSKRPLVSESVMTIQISVHPAGEEPDNMSYAQPLESHVRQPSTKSILGQNWALAPGMKYWFPAIVCSGHHPGLHHSSSKPH
jgi:hypothetical protein